MDRHAWSYTLAAAEMVREGKIDESAAPGSGRIPDARRFVHVEACTELENAAVTFSIRATDFIGTARWYDADRGMPAFRIVRSGCFRGAVPLPTGAGRADAIRFTRLSLPSRPSSAAATSGPGSVTLLRSTRSLVSVSAISRWRPCSTGRAAFLCRSTETGGSFRSR